MVRKFPKFIRAVLTPMDNISHINAKIPGVARIPVIEFTFLQMLSEHLAFELELLFPPDGAFGYKKADGNWSGIIGMLQRGEADMSIALLAINEQRQQVVDFSFPYTVQDQTFVTSIPVSVDHMLTYIYPFSTSVWISSLVAYFATSFFLYLLDSKSCRLLDMLILMFGSVCKQSLQTANKNIAYKMLFICWWLFVTFITLCYSSVLLSHLTIPLQERIIETTEELMIGVNSGNYKALISRGSSTLQQMMMSDQLDMKRMGERILENEWYYDVRENISNYFEEYTVLIGPRIKFSGALFENRHISQDSFGIVNVGIALRKNFCCKKTLDKVVLNSISGGLYQKFFKEEILRSEITYYSKMVFPDNRRSLTWENVHGIFILWFIGEMLSFICFLVEIIWYHLYHRETKIWWMDHIFRKWLCKK